MNTLAPNAAFITPAGTIQVPAWLEPFFACSADDKKALHSHMERIELPATAWNEWRKDLEAVQRVGDVVSYYDLFTIWIRVLLWQKACRVDAHPVDEWGCLIARELKANRINFALTPQPVNVLFPRLNTTSASFEAAKVISTSNLENDPAKQVALF